MMTQTVHGGLVTKTKAFSSVSAYIFLFFLFQLLLILAYLKLNRMWK